MSITQSIMKKTGEYLSVPSVVGHERFFSDYLRNDFEELGLSVFEYDGVLEVHGDDRKSGIICAHIDRHGLISLGDNEFGFAAQVIREAKYGENNLSSQKQVEMLAQRFEGEKVYAYHPDNGEVLDDGSILACYPHMKNDDALFYIENIGPVEPNIPLAFTRQAVLEDGYFAGQLDNVISLAVIYELFKAGYQGTVLLTCEEEIGKSWIYIFAYLGGMRIDTKNLLVIDTSPFDETEIIDEGPVVLRNRDKSESFSPELRDIIKARCEELNLPYLFKDEFLIAQGKAVEQLGSTELGKIVQHSEGHWNGATIQIPTLMYHTTSETTTTHAIENYFKILKDVLIDNPLEVLRVE